MSAKGHIWISATLSVLLLGGAVGAASAGPARPSAEVLPLPRDQAPDIPLHPDGGQKLLPAPGESERARQLDGLLKTLKGAVDNTEAKEVELEIWRLWLHSGSDAVDLLMKRVITAINDEDYSLALGCIKGTRIKCSLHGSYFDLASGQPLDEPADEAIRTFPVRTDGGTIYTRVD